MNQEPQVINLTLTIDKVNFVLGALSELPYKQSAVLITEIQGQASAQMPEPPKKEDDAEPNKGEAENEG